MKMSIMNIALVIFVLTIANEGDAASVGSPAKRYSSFCPAPKPKLSGGCIGKYCENDNACGYGEYCCGTECGEPICVWANPCNNYCANNGMCSIVDERVPVCSCGNGFIGPRCETPDIPRRGECPTTFPKDVCGKMDICYKDAECGNYEKCCHCGCADGLGRCVVTDPCKDFCWNGGVCSLSHGKPVCACPPGFGGDHCDIVLPPRRGSCPSKIIRGSASICNKAKCSNDYDCAADQKCCDGGCGDGNRCLSIDPCHGFECLNGGVCEMYNNQARCMCPDYYSGPHCGEYVDPCTYYECASGGVCRKNEHGKPYCQCKDGYSGDRCEINLCHGITCQNGGECAGGSCRCRKGYHGDRCQRDSCYGVECQHGGVCVSDGEAYECQCKDGYTGDYCEYDSCYNVVCQNGGACVSHGAHYECQCRDGFSGDYCEYDSCHGVVCQHGGNCVANGARFECRCSRGYTGTYCQHDSCYGVTCQYGGVCKSLGADYECQCKAGYSGKNCQHDSCHGVVCRNGGRCQTHDSDYECICADGFSGDHCEYDSCYNVDCQNGGSCVSHGAHYECQCEEGFSGDHCEYDSCYNVDCQNGGSCVSHGARYECQCEEGFSGDHCEFDACHGVVCQNRGTCEANGARYRCRCRRGFTGDFCQQDSCHGVVCQNGGTCESEGVDFRCRCLPGFSGDHCQHDSCHGVTCENGGNCVSDGADYECQCQPGFVGDRCQNDVCFEYVCDNGGSCVVREAAPFCVCLPNFGGDLCELRLSPCRSRNCRNGGICREVSDLAARCECQEGFEGEDCEIQNVCHGVVCQNGGVCVSDGASYECQCEEGYIGDHCETPLKPREGTCPSVHESLSEVCAKDVCNNDYDCEENEKCCTCACSDHKGRCLNTNPGPKCTKECRHGEVCVMTFPWCTHGRACNIKVAVQACVPKACVDCPKGKCKRVGNQHMCMKTDECGGCPEGKVCQKAGVWDLFQCVPEVPEVDECGGCGDGKSCVHVFMACRHGDDSCSNGFVSTPKCLPKKCENCNKQGLCDLWGKRVHCEKQTTYDKCGGCSDGKVCIDVIMDNGKTASKCLPKRCENCEKNGLCDKWGKRAHCEQDQCGGCANGKACIALYKGCRDGERCTPTYMCLPEKCNDCEKQGLCDLWGKRVHCDKGDECGGCPDGERCAETVVPCASKWGCNPKSTFQCVPINPDPWVDPEVDPEPEKKCHGLLGGVNCLLKSVLGR